MTHNRSLCLMVSVLAVIGLAACDSAPTSKPVAKKAQVVTEVKNYKFILDEHVPITAAQLQTFDAFVASVSPDSVASVDMTFPDTVKVKNKYLKTLTAHITSQGIKPDLLHVESTDESMILVAMTYTKIIPPGPCPDWSKNAITNYDNTGFSNFGCAYENDLAVQFTDPQDLERGHGVNVYDATRSSVSVGQYLSNSGAAASGSGGTSASPSATTGSTQ